MSGLDKMRSRILEEAEQSAQEIIAKARAEAEASEAAAEEQARAEAEKIREKAGHDAEEYEKRAASLSDMRRKQALLAAKQEVIGGGAGGKRMMQCSPWKKRPISNCWRSCLKNTSSRKPGRSASPREIWSACQRALLAGSGRSPRKKAEVSLFPREPRGIDGGFLLVYGGIEENCTIKAVFSSKREELSDRINRLLFG